METPDVKEGSSEVPHRKQGGEVEVAHGTLRSAASPPLPA